MLCFDVNRLTDIDIFLVLILFMCQEMADPGGIRGVVRVNSQCPLERKKKLVKQKQEIKNEGEIVNISSSDLD